MSAQPTLRLVNTETGESTEYVSDDAATIAYLKEKNEKLEADLRRVEGERRKQRAEIEKLKNLELLTKKQQEARPLIEEVFSYWQRECRHPKVRLTADRFSVMWGIIADAKLDLNDEAACAALKRRMFLAVDGAAFDPFVTRRKNGTAKRHDDLSLIFRSAEKMDEFIMRSPVAAEAEKRRQARQRQQARLAQLALPDPRSLGTSARLEMRTVVPGAHWQAR